MRIAYLDCFAGISGDMFLGALLHAGVPPEVFQEAVAALDVGASLQIETVDRSGISCTKVHVMEGEHLAEAPSHQHEVLEQHASTQEPLTPQLKTQHLHKGGHSHTHEDDHAAEHKHGHSHVKDSDDHGAKHGHSHVHGRSLTEIRQLIQRAPLHDAVKIYALRAFDLLGRSEAKIHNVPVDDIHFHEVGAVDAIVDIVATCAGIHYLGVAKWYSSPLNVGGGMVKCAHGTFPVPAPATADLLRDVPTYSAHVQKELVTPTGAALLRALDPEFGPQPAMKVQHIGYGAGTRDPKDFPNVLRLSVGEDAVALDAKEQAPALASVEDAKRFDTVTVLETALDDATPQLIAFVAEQALAAGALDVMLTSVTMKKGRPGTVITVLCDTESRPALEQLLLRETTTLGIRIRKDKRLCLAREHRTVETVYGPIRVKVGLEGGEIRSATPEYEDCKAAAVHHRIPLKQVQTSAQAAYQGRVDEAL